MLQSLELFGFKSFADRVKFDFDPGITCVVGPNGSGKSNVVDAIKWLLGDQSAKSLRGSEMSDVIFNGSSARGGSGYAEAILTFNNDSGLIPFAAREVAIGRRLYRSGESEYLLNGEAVRLKDIRALFLGTGAGSAAYSIIEQGRVGLILQANPSARRAVFEEAAGVSKFKARRVEAERRLARVATNLERLADIVEETETRLNATRSQASKAAKYRELTKELRDQWLGLAGDRYRVLTSRVDELTAQETGSVEEEQTLSQSLQELNAQLEQLTSELATVEKELSTSEAESSRRRETLASLRSTLRASLRQAEELDEERQRISSERWTEQSALQERQDELLRAEEQLRDAAKERLAAKEEAAEVAHQLTQIDSQREDTEQEQTDLQEAVATAQTEQAQRSETLRRHEHRREMIESELVKLSSQRDDLYVEAATAMKRVDALREEAAHVDREQAIVRDRLHDLRSQDDALRIQVEQTKALISKTREEKAAAETRMTVLRDLEPTSGNAVNAREILERAASSDTSPWTAIRGRVGDLLDCGVVDAPLIDIALGSRAHLIATEDLTSMVDYLTGFDVDLEGRVGFIETSGAGIVHTDDPTTVKDSFFADLEASYRGKGASTPAGESGVVARADTLVTGDETLAAAVLGDTWIVESTTAARSLHRRFPSCRFLTRAGELLETDGSMHFGQLPLHVAIVGRRAEIRELRAKVAQYSRTLTDTGNRLEALDKQRSAIRSELRAEESRQPAAVERAGKSQTTLAAAIERLESLRRSAEGLESDIERLEIERAELQSTDDAAVSESAKTNARIERLQAELKTVEEAIYQASRERAALEDQARELSVRSATLDARHTAGSQRMARLESDVSESIARVERFNRRATELTAKASEVTLAVLNTRAARDQMTLMHEQQSSQLKQIRVARSRIREAVDEIRKQQAEVDMAHRAVVSRREKAAMALREAKADLDRLAERCDEDFSMTLEEAAEAPSAYEKFIAELPEDVETPEFDEVADAIEQEAQRTRRKIKSLGSVNTESLKDLDELEGRYELLSAQLADLCAARDTLQEIIDRTNTESRRIFSETFETVRGHFQELFRKCFGGGSADLVLEEAEDVLDAGIDILARPPGKELRNLSLLSGGEKAMTAVALLMALFRAKPSPYCILDEVDAPLDEANIDRFLGVLREFREGTQFVVITHRRRTMSAADVIYGVTMETSGISKRLAVSLDQVAEDGSVKAAA